jgi:hypothetical protein
VYGIEVGAVVGDVHRFFGARHVAALGPLERVGEGRGVGLQPAVAVRGVRAGGGQARQRLRDAILAVVDQIGLAAIAHQIRRQTDRQVLRAHRNERRFLVLNRDHRRRGHVPVLGNGLANGRTRRAPEEHDEGVAGGPLRLIDDLLHCRLEVRRQLVGPGGPRGPRIGQVPLRRAGRIGKRGEAGRSRTEGSGVGGGFGGDEHRESPHRRPGRRGELHLGRCYLRALRDLDVGKAQANEPTGLEVEVWAVEQDRAVELLLGVVGARRYAQRALARFGTTAAGTRVCVGVDRFY